jgi:hypothetical protein
MEPKQRVILIVDRLAHSSLSDLDCVQSARGLQRLLNGKMPSEVLSPPTRQRSDKSQREITDLKQKLEAAETAKAVSERERARQINGLVAEIAKLQTKLDDSVATDAAPRDFFSYDEVIQIMVKKFGKHHGIPAALAERNSRLRLSDPSLGRITTADMQKWRDQNRYPAYVVGQINALTSDDMLSRNRWSEVERQYLAALYGADSRQSNCALAEACSRRFSRLITECSIKGELNRLRLRGMVGQYRRNDVVSNQ